jgi:hypothetical protein
MANIVHSDNVQARIGEIIKLHPAALFMKGSPSNRQCGFSAATAVGAVGADRMSRERSVEGGAISSPTPGAWSVSKENIDMIKSPTILTRRNIFRAAAGLADAATATTLLTPASAPAEAASQAGAEPLNGDGFYRFKIGDFRAIVISDGYGQLPIGPILAMNARHDQTMLSGGIPARHRFAWSPGKLPKDGPSFSPRIRSRPVSTTKMLLVTWITGCMKFAFNIARSPGSYRRLGDEIGSAGAETELAAV